jgi:hypothetical protein
MDTRLDVPQELLTLSRTIKRFTILRLLGEKTVSIDFQSGLTILIADNGVGKTTILSIIYAVLTRQLHRLRRVEFESITVEFESGSRVEILATAIQAPLDLSRSNPSIRRLLRQVPEQLVYQLFDETKGFDFGTFRRHQPLRSCAKLARAMPLNLEISFRLLANGLTCLFAFSKALISSTMVQG